METGIRKEANAESKGSVWMEHTEPKTNYTYLLQCADGSLYCGWTNQLQARVQAHNEGNGAKYTKSRRPVALVYYETFATKQEAMRREWAVKQMTRKQKLELIAGWQPTEVLETGEKPM